MIKIRTNNSIPTGVMREWLDARGVFFGSEYGIGMHGVEFESDGSIVFYPEYLFKESVDERVLLEFSLRFT